ncbi:DegT/DnrJ/EryC1/StrS family aminotransferase [Arthrobacter ginkgonis]|uniref:DegT/DnrJ/EryC1/StrS family aminotransferase n=2 Tax=Arthrobacter ginkgonis TaxID=1630594 RepID=A0ABP7CKV3_9MICC
MKPWLGSAEAEAVADVLASGRVGPEPRTAQFEAAFAADRHSAHAVATSSGTAALHLALEVAGVRRGDDVVVPSFASLATANAPACLGARPVFADVDPATGNVTARTLAGALSSTATAVIVVDQGGMPADLWPIRALCDEHGLTLVEDASCAAGSSYWGRPVGTGAHVTAWSFLRRRFPAAGNGGMLTTHEWERAERARRLREDAADMTELQAAVGLVQLDRIPHVVARRRELAEHYGRGLADVPGLRLTADPEYGASNFQSLWLEVLPEFPLERGQLLEKLAADDIQARRGPLAAHLHPAYAGHVGTWVPLPATERLNDAVLVLPLHQGMDAADVDRVVAGLRTAAAM